MGMDDDSKAHRMGRFSSSSSSSSSIGSFLVQTLAFLAMGSR
jgi:hypothetical protein